ncbi:MAG: roadblock/LC7 domain-containing protein [Xanthomonadales bacterium]|jgi:predicted regulator of Ras-like GTPase activity (Roadblock/LC7/MglB family)|nr:roadblock/LC7 domain-containing protein [Xanthomonadales bacterium]
MNVEEMIGKAGIQTCQSCIDSLYGRLSELKFLLLATTDGFEVAAAGDISQDDYSRMSAMASSLLSLSQAIVKDAELPACQDVIVDGVDGKILVLAVPGQQPDLLLMGVGNAQSALGGLIFNLRATAQEIRAALSVLNTTDAVVVNEHFVKPSLASV